MSRSKHARWFNPTRDGMWDEYYEAFWFTVVPVLGLFGLIITAAIVRGLL